MRALLNQHVTVFINALRQILSRPVATLLGSAAIGVALTIPMLLFILVDNLEKTVSGWQQGPGITIYLQHDVDDQTGLQLAEILQQNTVVDNAVYIDKTLGLDLFISSAGLGNLTDLLDQNPLPGVIEVGFSADVDLARVESLIEGLVADGRIDSVQQDLEWVIRLRALLDLVKRGVMILWALLLCGVTLVIANTIRMGVVTSRAEIEVISLVGGSDRFIRRPFLYSGAIQGALGGIFAALVLVLISAILSPAIGELLAQYGSEPVASLTHWPLMMSVIAVAAVLGWLAAWFSVTRYLSGLTAR